MKNETMSLADELRSMRGLTASPVLRGVLGRAASELDRANAAFHGIVAGIKPRLVASSEGVRAVEAARGWNQCADEVRRIASAALQAIPESEAEQRAKKTGQERKA